MLGCTLKAGRLALLVELHVSSSYLAAQARLADLGRLDAGVAQLPPPA